MMAAMDRARREAVQGDVEIAEGTVRQIASADNVEGVREVMRSFGARVVRRGQEEKKRGD